MVRGLIMALLLAMSLVTGVAIGVSSVKACSGTKIGVIVPLDSSAE